MKKILLSLAILGGVFNSNAQTETVIQDFNMSAVNSQATYDAAIALLNGGIAGSYTKWGADNGTGFDVSFSYAASATNSAGVAGFAVGEKLVYCTNHGQYSGAFLNKIPVDVDGAAAIDSISNVVSTKVTFLADKSYKIKFDASPRRSVTFDVLDVLLYQKDGTGKFINFTTLGNKEFTTADFGKKTYSYDVPSTVAAGDWYVAFIHSITGFNPTITDPTVALTSPQVGGVMLDKIVLVENALSTDEFLASKFSVYPNPANNLVNIANGENMMVNKVTVTDLNGRTVKNVSFDNVANVQVNVSDLASGLYLMNITSDKGTATKKFVKN